MSVSGRPALAGGAAGLVVLGLLAPTARAIAQEAPAHRAAPAGRLAAAPAVPPRASPSVPDPPLPVTTLGDGLHLVDGSPDGNVLVVTSGSETLVVDALARARAGPLAATVAELSPAPVRWVLATHFHEDHLGAIPRWTADGALVVAHRATAVGMAHAASFPELGIALSAAPAGARPHLLVERSLTLHLGDRTVRAVHLPAAHTAGDLVVHVVEDDVLHVGDIVEVGAYPFLDAWHGGSLEGLIAAVDAIDAIDAMATDATRFLPGHGSVFDRAELARYRAMLAGLLAHLERSVEAGDDLETCVAGCPSDDGWGDPRGKRQLLSIAFLAATGELAPDRRQPAGATGSATGSAPPSTGHDDPHEGG